LPYCPFWPQPACAEVLATPAATLANTIAAAIFVIIKVFVMVHLSGCLFCLMPSWDE
jgi:hypothetical protein